MPWCVAQLTGRAQVVLANAPFDTEAATWEHARRWVRGAAALDAARAEHPPRTMVVFAASDRGAAAEMARRVREGGR